MKKVIFIASVFASFTVNPQTFTLKGSEPGEQATEKEGFNGFGCTGKIFSPKLIRENPSTGTKSFAITIYGPDAPTGSSWWHWLIFDIPANTKELKSGVGNLSLNLAPAGNIQSIIDFKTLGYEGLCPPKRSIAHRYLITLYALKSDILGLDSKAHSALVGFML